MWFKKSQASQELQNKVDKNKEEYILCNQKYMLTGYVRCIKNKDSCFFPWFGDSCYLFKENHIYRIESGLFVTKKDTVAEVFPNRYFFNLEDLNSALWEKCTNTLIFEKYHAPELPNIDHLKDEAQAINKLCANAGISSKQFSKDLISICEYLNFLEDN